MGEVTPSNTQGLHPAMLRGYLWFCTQEFLLMVLGRPYGMHGSNPDWLYARQMPYQLYHHSSPWLNFRSTSWNVLPSLVKTTESTNPGVQNSPIVRPWGLKMFGGNRLQCSYFLIAFTVVILPFVGQWTLCFLKATLHVIPCPMPTLAGSRKHVAGVDVVREERLQETFENEHDLARQSPGGAIVQSFEKSLCCLHLLGGWRLSA